MSGRFTPGPWQHVPVDRDDVRIRDKIVAADGAEIVHDVNAEDDARLIAAAPDYAEFADEALPQLEALHSTLPAGEARTLVWNVILKGRAVVAKARGESQ